MRLSVLKNILLRHLPGGYVFDATLLAACRLLRLRRRSDWLALRHNLGCFFLGRKHMRTEMVLEEVLTPPDTLYHAARPECVADILREGLRPGRLAFVYLAPSSERIRQVLTGFRQGCVPLQVDVRQLQAAGIPLYRDGYDDCVAEFVPARCIRLSESDVPAHLI